MKEGFRYALEPLRLTRSWALDAALAALAAHNGRLAERHAALAQVLEQMAQARAGWLAAQAAQADDAALALGPMALLARYLQDGARRRHALECELAALESERATLAQAAAAARRALDAVEEHRDDARRAHRRARAEADLKTADDHWNVLHGRRAEHETDA